MSKPGRTARTANPVTHGDLLLTQTSSNPCFPMRLCSPGMILYPSVTQLPLGCDRHPDLLLPTFPGLESHHSPCLAGWYGPGVGQGQVQARRRGEDVSWRVWLGPCQSAAQPRMAAAAQRTGVCVPMGGWVLGGMQLGAGNLGSQSSSLLITSGAHPLWGFSTREEEQRKDS